MGPAARRASQMGVRRITSQRTHAPLDGQGFRDVLEAVVGTPFVGGNAIRRYRNGDEIFPAMLEAIAGARESILFLTFIYWTGDIARKFADALSERARAGVRVRVLLDSFGAKEMSDSLIERMEEAGAEVRWFRPIAQWRVWKIDNRTHRKVLIVDGRVGFTGGVGIAAEWEGDARDPSEWRDTHYRIDGPAVKGLAGAFWGNWMEVARSVGDAVFEQPAPRPAGDAAIQVIRSTASIGWSEVALLYDAVISLAQKRLTIVTAYFAPDPNSAAALRHAAERGVDVQVVIPGDHVDKRISELSRSNEFQGLMDAGVRIWRYQRTMLHVKLLLVDDAVACIGSANFNQRSMRQDDEVTLVTLDGDLIERLSADLAEDLEACELLDPKKWRERGLVRRTAEAVARMFWRET